MPESFHVNNCHCCGARNVTFT